MPDAYIGGGHVLCTDCVVMAQYWVVPLVSANVPNDCYVECHECHETILVKGLGFDRFVVADIPGHVGDGAEVPRT